MPYTDAGKNAMLEELASLITHAVAYDGDPTGAGTELDRQTIAFDPASGGQISASNDPEFDIQGSETVSFIGYIDSDDGDELLAYTDVTDEAFGGDGTYTLTAADFDLNNDA